MTLYHSVEITEIYSHSFLAKIRENNDFTNKITKSSFDGKNFG